MYLEHFSLRSQPFREHAAAAALWQDPRMKEGLAWLDFLTAMGELGMLTVMSQFTVLRQDQEFSR